MNRRSTKKRSKLWKWLIDADALEAVAEFYETELELREAPIVIEAEGGR